MPHVVVVGAGIIGATSALYLARAGYSVTVVERRPEVALGTSFANGALITPSTAMPWCSPAAIRMLVKWIGREDAPLLLRPSSIPKLGMWGLRFFANSRPSKFSASAHKLTSFARHSLEELDGLLAQRTVDFKVSRGGILELFRSQNGVAQRDDYVSTLDRLGINTKRLDPSECVAIEPSLAAVADTIRAGLLLPDDAWGDAREFSLATERAGRIAGVKFRFNTIVKDLIRREGRVAGIETDAGPLEADIVVICGGPHSSELLRRHGIKLPLAPLKGYSITLNGSNMPVMPSLPLLDDLEKIAITPLGNRLRVAGMVEFDGYDETIRPSRVENLRRAVQRLYPGMRLPPNLSPWAGLRPMAADGLPIIDGTSIRGLFVNAGHGGLGWTLACGSARLLADLVTQRPTSDANIFRLTRSFW